MRDGNGEMPVHSVISPADASSEHSSESGSSAPDRDEDVSAHTTASPAKRSELESPENEMQPAVSVTSNSNSSDRTESTGPSCEDEGGRESESRDRDSSQLSSLKLTSPVGIPQKIAGSPSSNSSLTSPSPGSTRRRPPSLRRLEEFLVAIEDRSMAQLHNLASLSSDVKTFNR